MTQDKTQLITMKGTKDGLTLFIDDTCSFEEAMQELQYKMKESKPAHVEPVVAVRVKLGYRYLKHDQMNRIKEIITAENRFTIQIIESDVVPREEVRKWQENSEIKTMNQIVRSGQVLHITGDLLLIGDVNPGGKVTATGNIFVMGNLRGIAHAGIDGDKQAFIVASYMNPMQLRIAHYISRAPDYESDGVYMECGLVDEEKDKIIIDRLQVLSQKRREINRFERRMLNG
ncbi:MULTISPECIES: septum site-determining protein MinC [Virgibacillus]|uniref:Probable septum site-determining protein MinC n=2 Tax=Virgibacillus TaxID=84406 RepID=A0A1M5M8M8_9BACI|nr:MULTISPECIES: septum site-determining protein MinC [Virgibacillus]SHG73586.1 septum site-determining protein MinC [Virgibacillus chiguensis]